MRRAHRAFNHRQEAVHEDRKKRRWQCPGKNQA
jgi:hypothetical protein